MLACFLVLRAHVRTRSGRTSWIRKSHNGSIKHREVQDACRNVFSCHGGGLFTGIGFLVFGLADTGGLGLEVRPLRGGVSGPALTVDWRLQTVRDTRCRQEASMVSATKMKPGHLPRVHRLLLARQATLPANPAS